MNKKKVIIASLILVLIIVGIIFCIFKFNSKDATTTTLTSSDGKFSIEMPNSIKYKINSIPDNDFTIDLYSEEDEMFMYATVITKARELDLLEVATDDKTSYFKDKENIRNDSGMIETKINNKKAIEYCLIYSDSQYNKDFYCHVVWIETSDYLYILNFEVVENNMDKYKDLFINIKNSFIEL